MNENHVHSYQNSVARTLSAEVLKHILGETWMKVILKYNAVMSSKKSYIQLIFTAAAKDSSLVDSWAQIKGIRKYCSPCI